MHYALLAIKLFAPMSMIKFSNQISPGRKKEKREEEFEKKAAALPCSPVSDRLTLTNLDEPTKTLMILH
jgi:hypothetical protein